jgi:indolepyruvate ferredoxin oxidoreductase alpha subunit
LSSAFFKFQKRGVSLKEEKKEQECTGFEALYLAALDSDVSLITGVPGYPITSLMELFLRKPGEKELLEALEAKDLVSSIAASKRVQNYSARWLTNEKVALEIALGASVSGRRALVLVKHVGMNLLSDPLITSVTHTIGAGLVIIAGDDPGAKGSQNEQDSRWYGRIAEVAVFDPADSDTAYRALRRAYELSEETKTPVILRVTAGLEESKDMIKRLPESSAPHPEFDRAIWKSRMAEKHQLFHSKTYPLLEKESENTDLNEIRERTVEKAAEKKEQTTESLQCSSDFRQGKIGIISSGFVSSIVEEVLRKKKFHAGVFHSEISHLSLSLVNPLPLEKIKAFLRSNQKILVAEESEPFIEEQIRIIDNVYGKKTEHLPYGQIRPEDIEFALEHLSEQISRSTNTNLPKIAKKSRTGVCTDCVYLPLYRFLSTLDVRIAGDMGCSVRSAPEPLAAVDVSFALGSAISVACGFDKKGIAVIGDFALAHSGILGLISAATTGCNVLVLVLQNEVAAMTGGQVVPDLIKVVEAITPDVSIFDLDSSEEVSGRTENATDQIEDEKEAESEIKTKILNSKLSKRIQEKLSIPGLSVIFIKGKCRKY